MEGARGPCGLEKVCQSLLPEWNGIQDSRMDNRFNLDVPVVHHRVLCVARLYPQQLLNLLH